MFTQSTMQDYGAAIRAARVTADRSRADVAAQIGISTSYLGKIERGDVSPSPWIEDALSGIFGPAEMMAAFARKSAEASPPPVRLIGGRRVVRPA